MPTCDHCGTDYAKTRSWQRFCTPACRQAKNNNSRKTALGPQGMVTNVRKLKDNGGSVTIHFVNEDARRSWSLAVGDVVAVVAESSNIQTDLNTAKSGARVHARLDLEKSNQEEGDKTSNA